MMVLAINYQRWVSQVMRYKYDGMKYDVFMAYLLSSLVLRKLIVICGAFVVRL